MVKKQGFSLIEVLIAMGILVTVGSVAMVVFFTTLRGATKSDVIREVKQNGEYAISAMETMIRSSQSVESIGSGCSSSNGCLGSGSCIKILNPDNQYTVFSLSGTQIASTGGNLTNNKVRASGLSFTCSQPPGAPPIVTVSFTLTQATSTTRVEEQASIPFKTTISLRNY